jgi:hypothetical protein
LYGIHPHPHTLTKQLLVGLFYLGKQRKGYFVRQTEAPTIVGNLGVTTGTDFLPTPPSILTLTVSYGLCRFQCLSGNATQSLNPEKYGTLVIILFSDKIAAFVHS